MEGKITGYWALRQEIFSDQGFHRDLDIHINLFVLEMLKKPRLREDVYGVVVRQAILVSIFYCPPHGSMHTAHTRDSKGRLDAWPVGFLGDGGI